MRYGVLMVLAFIGFATRVAEADASVLTNAKDLKPDSAMHKYLYSEEAARTMYRVAIAMDQQFGLGCGSEYNIKPIALSVLAPINLPDGAKYPTEGAWTFRFDASRCDAVKRYNIIMAARPDGPPRLGVLPPGNSIASFQSLKDAAPAVRIHAWHDFGKDCKDIRIFDTTLVRPPHDETHGGKTLKGVWMESWQLRGCGKSHDYAITFIPDSKGGTTYAIGEAPPAP